MSSLCLFLLFLNHAIVLFKPASRSYSGFQFVIFNIFLLSQHNLSTSLPCGRILSLFEQNSISLPMILAIFTAKSFIDISSIIPIFVMCPLRTSLFFISKNQFIVSNTYVYSRVGYVF